MEALVIYESVLRELDRFGSPRYDVDDHNYFVNSAKEKVVEALLESYEITQRVTEMLENIVVTDEIVFNANDKSSIKTRPLRVDFDSLKSCLVTFRAAVDFDCFKKGDRKQIPARRLTEDAEMFSMTNSYYTPSFLNENVFYQVRNKKVEILFDTLNNPEKRVVVEKIEVEHTVTVPDIILGQNMQNIQNSVLHKKVSRKIIELTATLFLENSKSQRTNSFTSINQ